MVYSPTHSGYVAMLQSRTIRSTYESRMIAWYGWPEPWAWPGWSGDPAIIVTRWMGLAPTHRPRPRF